jgi:outer membrane protein assembly factor BamA
VVNPGMIRARQIQTAGQVQGKRPPAGKDHNRARVHQGRQQPGSTWRFVFDEGRKVQIERINFHGNVMFDRQKAAQAAEKNQREHLGCAAAISIVKNTKRIKGCCSIFMRNHGYRDIEILRDSVSYNELNDEMYIDIWINEGPQYTFGDITFEGNKILPPRSSQPAGL